MRRLLIVAFAFMPTVASAHGSTCLAAANGAEPRLILDHYVYDPSLHRDWEVLIDCKHPAAPAQMKLVPDTTRIVPAAKRTEDSPVSNGVKAGASVVVSNGSNALTSIRLSGTAMQTAFRGQPIRVRLSSSGHFITGFVRGPHSVELISAANPQWGTR